MKNSQRNNCQPNIYKDSRNREPPEDEVAMPQRMFQEILVLITRSPVPSAPL
jgi:hypothetical protein